MLLSRGASEGIGLSTTAGKGSADDGADGDNLPPSGTTELPDLPGSPNRRRVSSISRLQRRSGRKLSASQRVQLRRAGLTASVNTDAGSLSISSSLDLSCSGEEMFLDATGFSDGAKVTKSPPRDPLQ